MIALTTILIMGALMLSVGIGVTLRSISEGDMSSGEELSARAGALSEACAEAAVLRLKNNLSYSGNEAIMVQGSDTCDILAAEGVGNANRVIKTQSTAGGYTRKIRVALSSVTPLQIAEWRFVGDF
jgi:hypothetical protein